jgi:hypothetical protein
MRVPPQSAPALRSGTGMASHSTALSLLPAIQGGDSSLGVAPDSPRSQMRPLDAPKIANRNESAEDYSRIVAVLNGKWRVIECRDRIQWILQSRDTLKALSSAVWRGRSYCRTSAALNRLFRRQAGAIDPTAAAALAALPDWIEAPNLPARSPTTRSAAEEHI